MWPDDPTRWQVYPSLNDVQGLAFAPDGALWAAIIGGVVRWDLTTDIPTYYGVANGLPSEFVQHVVEADNGEVWVASAGGVSRFDGVTWTTYTRIDGLPADMTYALAVAPDGTIWAGTESGLAHFDGMTWIAFTPADGLPGGLVWSVDIDAQGVVWASTSDGGALCYDPQRDVWTTYGTEAGFRYPNARVLAVAPDGMPWLHVGYDGVYRFDGDAWQLAYENGDQWVCDIAFAADSMPWLATCGGLHAGGVGLAYAEGDTWRYVTMADGLPGNTIDAVAISPTGVIAAGTDRGIGVYQGGRWRILRHGPTLNEIATVATAAGAVWFGFGSEDDPLAGGGVARFDGTDWQYWVYPHTYPLNGNVRVLAFAPDGALWAAGGGGVARFDGTTWMPIVASNFILANNVSTRTPVVAGDVLNGPVQAIAFASPDVVWIATHFDLYRLADATLTMYPDRGATAITITPDGGLWVGLSPMMGGGLGHFDGTTWTTDTTTFPLRYVEALLVDEAGPLWASGVPGVARFDGTAWEQWTEYTEGNDLLAGKVVALAFSPDGVLWAATDRAVLHFDGVTWHLDAASGVATIYAFSFAPDGSLWLATSKGAVHFRP